MMSEQQQGNPHGNQPNLHDEDTLARDWSSRGWKMLQKGTQGKSWWAECLVGRRRVMMQAWNANEKGGISSVPWSNESSSWGLSWRDDNVYDGDDDAGKMWQNNYTLV
jgi:hypothetical protein